MVVHGTPSWSYYPQPYPVYHYPYQPGSTFIAGLVWGAALSSLWNGNYYQPRWSDHGHGRHSIYVHRSHAPAAPRLSPGAPPPPRDSVWRPNRRPEQIAESVGRSHPGRASGERALPVPVMRALDRSERNERSERSIDRSIDRPVERGSERTPERTRAVSPREPAPAFDGAERRSRDTGRDVGRDSEREVLRDNPRDNPRAVVPSRVTPAPDMGRDEFPTRPGRDVGRDMGRDVGRDTSFPRASREDAPEGRMAVPQRVERPSVIHERTAPREVREMREPSRDMGEVRGAREIREPSRDMGEMRGGGAREIREMREPSRDMGEARGARESRGEVRESRDFGGGGGAREGREGREGRGF